MGRREKFGKLVLLEEVETGGLGSEYRAAKLGPAGFERIVTVLRLQGAISGNAEAARALMDQVKLAAQLQNPNILKIFGIGKVDQSYYISYEHIEGRSLRAILRRCRQESFPFSVEHALLVASKVCTALEYAHGRRSESGARYFHGLLTPACVLVSYEGEVRVKGFGYWPGRVKETGAFRPEEMGYIAPEQAAGGGDVRSDLYSLGAILLETLAGQVPEEGADLVARLPSLRLWNPSGDEETLPPAIAEILRKSLARDPAARYAEVAEMRKAIDTLLFSSDFTPTTFNLAFFMHSLHRDDIEKEARILKEEKEASYLEFLVEEAPRPAPAVKPPVPTPPPASPRTEPAEARPSVSRAESPLAPEPVVSPPPSTSPHDSSPALSARNPAASLTFHRRPEKPSRMPLLAAGGAAVLLLGGGISYWLFSRAAPPPPPPVQAAPSLSPEALVAQQRVKELEEKLAALEAEKLAAEAKAAEEARKKVESQARAKGQDVDPAALQKAQEDARRRAKEDQERKQQEETRRLDEERKAEEARLAEERRKAEELAKGVQAAAATPEPTALPEAPPPTAAPTPAPAPLRPGTLVNLNDTGVIPPVAEVAPSPVYPPIALRQRTEGVVELNVLVDEKGRVTDAQIVSGVSGKTGLNEAALDSVKKRRYRPASKDGVPVKVWISVRIKFQLPQ